MKYLEYLSIYIEIYLIYVDEGVLTLPPHSKNQYNNDNIFHEVHTITLFCFCLDCSYMWMWITWFYHQRQVSLFHVLDNHSIKTPMQCPWLILLRQLCCRSWLIENVLTYYMTSDSSGFFKFQSKIIVLGEC